MGQELYGISGSKGHGKDTFARLVMSSDTDTQDPEKRRKDDQFHINHFAAALKRMAGRIFGLTDEQMHSQDLKEAPLPAAIEMDKYVGRMREETGLTDIQPAQMVATNPREVLQFFGTEYVRRAQDNYWIQRLITDVQPYGRVLVPDTRFLNEAKAIREAGGKIIKILRIDLPQHKDGHASETEMAQIDPDLLIGVRTHDVSLPKFVASLIRAGKFSEAQRYDYRVARYLINYYGECETP